VLYLSTFGLTFKYGKVFLFPVFGHSLHMNIYHKICHIWRMLETHIVITYTDIYKTQLTVLNIFIMDHNANEGIFSVWFLALYFKSKQLTNNKWQVKILNYNDSWNKMILSIQ
jgi:hypothetical protein